MAAVNRRRARRIAAEQDDEQSVQSSVSLVHPSNQLQSSHHSFPPPQSDSDHSSVPGRIELSDSDETAPDSDKGTDENMNEDFPRHTDVDETDEDGQPVIDPNDLLIVEGMEDEEKHAKKWREYEQEKARLLRERWTVERKAPMSQGIDISEQVQERHGRQRFGESQPPRFLPLP
ncbi:hypothetical protein SEMRO_711_G191220.1 [Seminavis robusta]|uniref:Uncharacterized protein n=1 Tax=Seminavis robusta TaxID=568900 RepID=A0A9N8HHJ4_9STRA|nr:hypothetical protein SEMRO_711_G191220.1 [Seminavis robusta]|eukprot:Sro711_g191220.1 n/a (175) ;mRNA; f:29245-29836